MFFRFILVAFLISSCSLFSSNDKKEDDACDWPPGNRNYSWRIDTVGYWPSILGGLYVFNDSTAFITGRVNTIERKLFAGLRWNGTAWLEDIYSPIPEFPMGHYGLDATGDDTLMVSVGYWDLNNGFKSAIGEFNLKTKTWKKYQFETIGRLNSVWTDKKGFYVAVGENGVIYTKASASSDWVYSKMEDEFNLTKVSGISKTEWYLSSYKYPDPRKVATLKLYRYLNGEFLTLYNTQTNEGNFLELNKSESVMRIKAFRCTDTDSLYLFIPGETTFKVTSFGNDLSFNELNLKDFYTNQSENFGSGWVYMTNPRNVWMPTPYYGLYHYNGFDIQKIETIPNLPYGDTSHSGLIVKMFFSESGKIWMLIMSQTQQYLLIQGTPN